MRHGFSDRTGKPSDTSKIQPCLLCGWDCDTFIVPLDFKCIYTLTDNGWDTLYKSTEEAFSQFQHNTGIKLVMPQELRDRT